MRNDTRYIYAISIDNINLLFQYISYIEYVNVFNW